jgi:hypothetical protein
MTPRLRSSPSPLVRLLVPALCGLALTACKRTPDADGESSRGLKVEAYDAPIPKAPVLGKLDTLPPAPAAAPAPASGGPSAASDAPPAVQPQAQASAPPSPQTAARRTAVQRATAPAAPRVSEPRYDLYDREPAKTDRARAAPEPAAEAPGFHITVPICRQAERQSDPLARTPECTALLKAAEQQARDCARAFEEGNDQAVLSPGCRQAAGFR